MTRHHKTSGARSRLISVGTAGACAVALGLGLGLASPASASGSGGDVSAPGPQFATNQASIDQLQLTKLETQLHEGKISASTYAAAQRAYDAGNGTSRVSASTADEPGTSMRPPPDEQPPPAARSLSYTHYAQEKGYWCGPAAGKMIVKMMTGGSASRYNGATFSQTSFAGSAHMLTEQENKTAWETGYFTRGLNRWIGSQTFQQIDSPSAATVRSALRGNIGLRLDPVAADTVEFAGSYHYNGHPTNQTIGHWIVAYGYTNDGDNVKFLDPSTSVWSGVDKVFSANTATFTSRYLQTNGIAY